MPLSTNFKAEDKTESKRKNMSTLRYSFCTFKQMQLQEYTVNYIMLCLSFTLLLNNIAGCAQYNMQKIMVQCYDLKFNEFELNENIILSQEKQNT